MTWFESLLYHLWLFFLQASYLTSLNQIFLTYKTGFPCLYQGYCGDKMCWLLRLWVNCPMLRVDIWEALVLLLPLTSGLMETPTHGKKRSAHCPAKHHTSATKGCITELTLSLFWNHPVAILFRFTFWLPTLHSISYFSPDIKSMWNLPFPQSWERAFSLLKWHIPLSAW